MRSQYSSQLWLHAQQSRSTVWRAHAGEQHLPTARRPDSQSGWFNNMSDFWAFIIRHHTCSDRLQGSSSRKPSNLPPAPCVARTTDSELAAHESGSHSNRLALESRSDQSGARCLERNSCCCSIILSGSRGGGATRLVCYTKHPTQHRLSSYAFLYH